MHILLTDVLSCPRCGPRFGLIVLADRLENRRVVAGSLGCSNCREQYVVRDGIADLRVPGESALPLRPASPREDAALRIAALMGAVGQPGVVLLVGADAALAAGVADLLPDTRVVSSAVAEGAETGGSVSWILHGGRLPLRDRSMRGVALIGEYPPALVEEAERVVAAGARIVLDPAPPGSAEALRSAGLEVLLEQEEVVVASPSARR